MIYYDSVIWGDEIIQTVACHNYDVFHTSASFQHFDENVSLF